MILGGAAVHCCDKRIVWNTALAAEGRLVLRNNFSARELIHAGYIITIAGLLQAQVHRAVFIEVDVQHTFLPAGEFARHCIRLVRSARGSDLHAEHMFTGRHLHGMEFMALDVMKHSETFFIRSFQQMRIGQTIIDPDRQMGLGEFVVNFDFQSGNSRSCGRICRRNYGCDRCQSWGSGSDFYSWRFSSA